MQLLAVSAGAETALNRRYPDTICVGTSICSSTRRFCALPATVPLLAIGRSRPMPSTSICSCLTPRPCRTSRTAFARRSESSSLCATDPVESVCPVTRMRSSGYLARKLRRDERPFSDDPLDDAVAVQRLQGFLGCDAADAEELRKLHLGRHAIPHAQPARPDLVQDVVVQSLVQEWPVVVLGAHDEGPTLV